MNVLGIDIGGTGIKGALVDTETGEFVTERYRLLTPKPGTPRAVAKRVARLVERLGYTGPVGVGFPGPVKRNTVLMTTHLDRAWIGMDAASTFAESTGLSFTVLNDADAAGMAEMRFGAGRGQAGTVLVVTFGTGIGTALFVDGRLVPNLELGHVEFRGRDAEYHASARIRKERGLSWKRWARQVNEYLGYLEKLVAPDLIIIGGGVSKSYQKFVPLFELHAPVMAASMRNNAGIVGAAVAAQESAAITSAA